MTNETLKKLLGVLRVFVGAASKGNPVTLYENEILTQVCKDLHIRKEKEIKRNKPLIRTILSNLKTGRILYETVVDNTSTDKLNRLQPIEIRRMFGLTDPAVRYIQARLSNDATPTSEKFLLAMLRHDRFAILPSEPLTTAPEATPATLVEAVEDIKQEITPKMDTTITEAAMTPINHNAARIAAEVRNIGTRVGDKSPERLLGALRQLSAFDGNSAAVATTIGWDPHAIKPCRDAIQHLNLIGVKKLMHVHTSGGQNHRRHKGIFLTPLGRQVAEIGGFEDHIPPDQRWSRSPTGKKNGNMLKNSKKEQKPNEAGGVCIRLSDGSVVSNLTVQEAIEFQRAFGLTPAAGPVDVPGEPVASTATAVAVKIKTLNDYQTIAALLRAVTTALCTTIADLETRNESEAVNVGGVSLGLTEVGHMLTGFKHYINRCVRGEATLDIKSLQDYAAQMELDLERIEKQREFPVLGDIAADMGYGRVLRSGKAIKKTVWTP